MNQRLLGTAAALGMLLALGARPVIAQGGIRVVVNGSPVEFDTIGPRQTNGHVLVPLRGVLEKIGAYVDWDSATQTVLANKGDTSIRLPIGSRYATVNGSRVLLDTPATTMAGSTMVPLRFLSESLGATVRWNERTNTVLIFTGERTARDFPSDDTRYNDDRYNRAHRTRIPPVDRVRMPSVEWVKTDHSGGWLHGGETIHVTMQASPGGKAFFRIRGVVGERKMNETSSGYYEGWYRIPVDENHRVTNDDILAFVVIGDRSTAETHPF